MKEKSTSLYRIISWIAIFVVIAAAALTLCLTSSADEIDDVMPDNGIPVVIINIDESRGTIQAMNASTNHSVYCYGTVTIKVPEGFHYSDFPDNICESVEDLAMSIRGRGNSSWQFGKKKPYKIKLDKKTDLFGFGKNKHWVLVANEFDDTLLRDRITAWLGDQIGLDYTPRGVPVDVVMTGSEFGTKYLGSYYFSENVRVDDNRIEIDELDEDDVDMPTITGGYLLQDGLQVRDGSADKFKTKHGVNWSTDTPSFDTEPGLGDGYDNPAQQQYIQNHIQKAEDALYADGTGYREYFDLESAAKYWLIQDFCMNNDGFATSSTYIYKERDKDGVTGKIYWGPLWDFDYAWDYITGSVEGFNPKHPWISPLFYDREEGGFIDVLNEQWLILRGYILDLIKDGGIIDQYAAETRKSAYEDRPIAHGDADTFDYDQTIEGLKEWIRRRLEWYDMAFDQLKDTMVKVRYMSDGEMYTSEYVMVGNKISTNLDYLIPEKEGYVFKGWLDEEGNPFDKTQEILKDRTLTASYVPEDEVVTAQFIVFMRDRVDIKYNPFYQRYNMIYEIFPTDAEDNYVIWTSSDPTVATIEPNGSIFYYKEGTTVITATLRSGYSKQFIFHVSEDGSPDPESITPDKDLIELKIGESDYFTITTDPLESKAEIFKYSILDESVATIDDFGVITAVGPGKTQAVLRVYKDDGEYVETVVDVVVSEEESEEESSEEESSVAPPDDKPNPDTGDHTNPIIFVITGLAGIVIILLAVILIIRSRRKK